MSTEYAMIIPVVRGIDGLVGFFTDVELADNAPLVPGVMDRDDHASRCDFDRSRLRLKVDQEFWGCAGGNRQRGLKLGKQAFNLSRIVDHVAAATAMSALGIQFQGNSVCKSFRFVCPETTRSSTSAR